jgi:hypothetical protein
MENQTGLNQMVVTNDFLPVKLLKLPEKFGILKGNIEFETKTINLNQQYSYDFLNR